MTVRRLRDEDEAAWWTLREELFPDSGPGEIREPAHRFAGDDQVALVHERSNGRLDGFVEASIRRYADGCTTSPVGFLEAWYVVPDVRGQGVGAQLVAAAEDWVRSKGCSEMGSDTWADNEESLAAHLAVGYREVELARHFAKRLGPAMPSAPAVRDGAAVTLRTITSDIVRAITALDVAPHQQAFVAPNAESLAEAYVTTMVWPRAIYADDVPVGFVMLSDDDQKPRYYLWRFMIDQHFQGRGFGRAAMDLVEAYVRTRPGGTELYLSYVPAPGGPHAFYLSCGYEDTGREEGGEREMVKRL